MVDRKERQLIADAAEAEERFDQQTLEDAAKAFQAIADPIQYEFDRWINTPDGDRAYEAVMLRCRMLKRAGHIHYGIGAIWEAIRFDYSIRLGPDHGFKMNNNYRSRMARYIMRRHKDLDGFFETRRLR